jgi:hypothetical protein
MMQTIFIALVSASAYLPSSYAWPLVGLDKGLIPKIDVELPILSLHPPAAIPQDLLKQFIYANAPNATLVTDYKTGEQSAYDGDRLVALVDPKTGETRVFPNIEAIGPANGSISINPAFHYIRNSHIFPTDHTNFSIVAGSNLVGSTSTKDGNHCSDPQLYLSHAVVQRNITSCGKVYPVCGPGSKASFGFAADGNVHSLSYMWRPATLTGRAVKSNKTDVVYDSIVKELSPAASAGGPVTVDGVDVCLYDSGSKYIQPVYRFWATLHAETVKNVTTAPSRILGYIPIGQDSPEPIPSLHPNKEVAQPTAPTPPSQVNKRGERRSVLPNIKVGRYVVRDDYPQWVTNANNFLSNLQIPSAVANFVNSQYYWAYPYLFTSSKNSYINSVQIADIEVHGNWHVFSTEKNCCDLVHLADIPADGYGGGGGGSLAYWIIHSCEVIPTPTDYSAADRHLAFDDWFRIFNGLHAVVGYRTEMWIGDSVIPTFASKIAKGAPFVSTWLQAVHDDTPDYHTSWGADQLYHDGNRNIDEPMGRPSAVFVCGHGYDTVLQTQNLGRPRCLREMWYNN